MIKLGINIMLLITLAASAFAQTKTFSQIIIVVQENRTPDNLFQGLCVPINGPGAPCPNIYNISPNGVNPTTGAPIALTPATLYDTLDPDHKNESFVDMYNNGGIDQGPDWVYCTQNAYSPYCCPPNQQGKNPSSCVINGVTVYNWLHYTQNDNFKYVDGKNYNRLDPLLAIASQYGWANYFFQTNQGPSMPAHQFLLSGTSAQTAPPNTLFAAENPLAANDTGCTAPSGELVEQIDNLGTEGSPIYPCFDHPTLTDRLDATGRSWRWYSETAGSIWTAPNAIQHICLPTSPVDGTCQGQDWLNNVKPYVGAKGPGMLLKDLGVGGSDSSACNLAQVSWVIPDGYWSDHGGIQNGGQYGPLSAGFGPSWLADIVDAVGGVYYDSNGVQNKTPCNYWTNTAVLITWDDWGGWYDHVEPFNIQLGCATWGCGYTYGFRVPFLFVSAYTPQGFVSGTVNQQDINHCPQPQIKCYDFGSILKFVENNFNLGLVEGPTQYADAFANGLEAGFSSLTNPRTFTPIPAPVPATCFVDPTTACFPTYNGPTDPDNDASD